MPYTRVCTTLLPALRFPYTVSPNFPLLFTAMATGLGVVGGCDAGEKVPMPDISARLKETRLCDYTPSHEEVRSMAPCILNLGNARKWVVSFTLQPL
jgi:hypothetical protein